MATFWYNVLSSFAFNSAAMPPSVGVNVTPVIYTFVFSLNSSIFPSDAVVFHAGTLP